MPNVGEVGCITHEPDVYDRIAAQMGSVTSPQWAGQYLLVPRSTGPGDVATVLTAGRDALIVIGPPGLDGALVLGPQGGVGYAALGPRLGFKAL